MTKSSTWQAAGLLLLGTLLVGCGAGGDGRIRHDLAGRVAIAGKNLETGAVVFHPADPATQGAPVHAAVAGGRYSARVPAGRWRVTFGTGPPAAVTSSGPPVKAVGLTIPPRYRDGIDLKVSGPNPAQDFDLKAR